ncbi:unannotated protein [freshwater metagenome]|uniref:Unannotated protein n=1 Tax=freshwater metagenome TaxID=449393 RepID=A0A6J6EAG7_9ZZZZ
MADRGRPAISWNDGQMASGLTVALNPWSTPMGRTAT